ncbi:MAG: hypothetical protein JNL32_04490 [Candidatus Kapabacteria bacterium]|nr:hypothetical protein [Candidatus Kapabacteria bacterium]
MKLPDGGTFKVDLKSYTNYYPYGMAQPKREWGAGYRYGYNGVEEDDELKGDKNSLSTYYRLYDPRLALWLGIDPVVHESESPYAAMGGNPILYADPSGAEGEIQEFTSDIKDPNKNPDLTNMPSGTSVTYNGNHIEKYKNGKWQITTAIVDVERSKWSNTDEFFYQMQRRADKAFEGFQDGMRKAKEQAYYDGTYLMGALSAYTSDNFGGVFPEIQDVNAGYGAGRRKGHELAKVQSVFEMAAGTATTGLGLYTLAGSGTLAVASAPAIPFGVGAVTEVVAGGGATLGGAMVLGGGVAVSHGYIVMDAADRGIARLNMQMTNSNTGSGGNTSGGNAGDGGNAGGGGTTLKPEAKYLKRGKHGLKWDEGSALAKSTGKPQGQWGSKADLDFAGNKAATLNAGEGAYFELPSGHSSIVHMPDGTTKNATHMWVRNNGTGTFHGYPLIK